MEDAKEVCPTRSQKRLKEGAVLVDIREQDEIARLSFDVPGLITIPFSEFETRFSELPKDKDLIIASNHGTRSLKATYFLMYHGYERVFNMSGGMAKWVFRQFPIKGDPTAVEMPANTSCCG
ncbi:rhodanese-like domain-containing protein [Tolumonas osonensis]|uniref:Rhodanese-related sulfurtransferase n=1 Tax=Tolumonas osonensis TaxID=675874 RepID=A0A841GE94_9GAMM|nr:rhodanese-like domain-containing protein [Tolumonas osonensis]MBB6056249.1 rhodanese-related sulfurtransferase [Tolumonas osonensis]